MKLIFVKLGGSVITNKTKPMLARLDVIKRLAEEINEAMIENPKLRIVLGHGSGSFGHSIASKLGFKNGNTDPGIAAQIHKAAAKLHEIILKELASAISCKPSVESVKAALDKGKIPVVYGDIVNNGNEGFEILSTEQMFKLLIDGGLKPENNIMVGEVDGFYKDMQNPQDIFEYVDISNAENVKSSLIHPRGEDVTGGMLHKLETALEFAEQGINTLIINGLKTDRLKKTLLGQKTKGSFVGKNPQ